MFNLVIATPLQSIENKGGLLGSGLRVKSV